MKEFPKTFSKPWEREDELGCLQEELRTLRETLVRVQTALGSAEEGEQLILVARHAALAEEELAEIDIAILAGQEVPRRKATLH
ncbi:MAG: hypothetical protein EBQ78_05775 [Betaproteobacteria bacterium]|jgi:hypothetical protein|nr:hypothetical protein [Betaproteobacteria bacterium]NBY17133.1 hypothetical protein [Betaproteobacteria bacterium]